MSRKHSPHFAECLAAVRSGETNRLKHNWQSRLHKWEMKKIFHEKYLFMVKTIVNGNDMPRGWNFGLTNDQINELYKLRGFGKVEKSIEHSKIMMKRKNTIPKRETKKYVQSEYLKAFNDPRIKLRILSKAGKLKYKPITMSGNSMRVYTYENDYTVPNEIERVYVCGEFDSCFDGYRRISWKFQGYKSTDRFCISYYEYKVLFDRWWHQSFYKCHKNRRNSWKFIRKSIVEDAKRYYAKIKEREEEDRSRRQLDLSMMLGRNDQSNNESLRQLRALGFIA